VKIETLLRRQRRELRVGREAHTMSASAEPGSERDERRHVTTRPERDERDAHAVSKSMARQDHGQAKSPEDLRCPGGSTARPATKSAATSAKLQVGV